MSKEVRVIIVYIGSFTFSCILEITAENGEVIELKSDITEVGVLTMYQRLIKFGLNSLLLCCIEC